MARLSLLALALTTASTVTALPQWHWPGFSQWNSHDDPSQWNSQDNPSTPSGCGWGRWQNHQVGGATPTLPLSDVSNTGASPLPTPTTAVKYVALGLGFQNYTCSAVDDTTPGTWIQTAASTGAIADLYDITRDVNSNTKDSITRTVLQSFEQCLAATHCTPSPSNAYCEPCHRIAAMRYQRGCAGEHFFAPINGAQSPNFAISATGDFLSGKKAAAVTAPSSAYAGANALGAVPWLYLVSNGSPLTHGLTSVYRVETAGGVAPSSCTGAGALLQVPYSAEYWFFG